VTLAQRWLRHPQKIWLRRALFQVHLWTGLALGLYIVAISLSGSALVFRDRIFKAIGNKPRTVVISGPRLPDDKLRSLAEKAFPHYRAGYVFRAKQRDQASIVVLDRNGKYKQELFDPYGGQDLGPADPAVLRALTWLADLHFNLLAGEQGRRWNGYAAILVTLVVLTGAVIWWPGMENWRRSLAPSQLAAPREKRRFPGVVGTPLAARPGGNWKRFNWELHSMIGFWTYAFSLMWGITGIYVVFPAPFQRVAGLFLTPDLFDPRHSPDEQLLRWFSLVHFGNFGPGEWMLRTVWVIAGLAPPLLFVTGVLMWSNRKLWPRARRFRQPASNSAGVAAR
jgi:uncharacterized iron-regulated membrane protein